MDGGVSYLIVERIHRLSAARKAVKLIDRTLENFS